MTRDDNGAAASALGASSAPKMPCGTRAATSVSMLGARAAERFDAEARDTDREHAPLAEHVAERAADHAGYR